MASRPKVRIADIATTKGLAGGPFGSSLGTKDYVPAGIPVIRGVNLATDGRFNDKEFVYVTPEKADALSRNIARPSDVVFTQRGTLGQVGLVPPSPAAEYVISQSQMRLRVRPELALPEFIYYQFKSPEMISTIHNLAITTGVPHINLGILANLQIDLPSLGEQQAICQLLGSLDDKIAINDRICFTSHELTSATLAGMLIDDLHATTVALGEVAAVNQRMVRPRPGGFLRYVDISSVSVDRFEWPHRIPWEEAPSRARRGVIPGDTIWSTVRPGRRSRALILEDDPELVASTGFAVLTPQEVGPAFLYEVTRRDEFVHYLESVAEGSAYPAVHAARFEKAPVPLLSSPYLAKFEIKAIQLQRRVQAARNESRTLTQLRDTLLPKLMSGAIRVREAEKAMEEAM